MQRRIVDETGLQGAYTFKLQLSPDQNLRTASPDSEPPTDGPSLFTALEEQLGLVLKSSRGPVEVLIIDHAAKPAAN